MAASPAVAEAGPLARVEAVLFDHAPRWLGALTFVAGVMSMIASANPSMLGANPVLMDWLVAELPNFAAAIGGLALMALSLGLMRRIWMAWAFTLATAAHGLWLSVFVKPWVLEAVVYAGLIVVLIAARRAFFRRSALLAIRLPRIWFFAAGGAIALAAVGAALWAGHRSGFVAAEWWDLIIHPVIGAAGRPILLATLILAFLAFGSLVTSPVAPHAPPPGGEDFRKVEAILAATSRPRPEGLLAFAGDKSFLFSEADDAFIMFASIGNAIIAFGAPIGPRARWKPLLSQFRQRADQLGANCAVYAAPPDLLPDLLDLGFKVEKVGENAIIDLPAFSLAGGRREVIRRGRRKLAERSGARFQMIETGVTNDLMDRLKPVSDAWLTAQKGKEKAFSLGRFDPDFLQRCPIGVVEIGGRTAAFGTLLATPDRSWAGIDLMRYDPEIAVTNTMDFLLVEMILWAKEAGFQRFDLSMAPLSGLVEEDHAPLFARIGNEIYQRSERFYNFQGLRRFKEKFDPEWEPRYIAAPGYWDLPVALAQAALLTNGAARVAPAAGAAAGQPQEGGATTAQTSGKSIGRSSPGSADKPITQDG
ncbi:GNAT family N-acetyltransferase [bacterium]|nr:GNAT family N-acetyltransferase [bacterium]